MHLVKLKKMSWTATLTFGLLLSGCSKNSSPIPVRPAPNGSEALSAADVRAGFVDESGMEVEIFALVPPGKGDPSSESQRTGGVIITENDDRDGSEDFVHEEILVETTVAGPAPRPYENSENLQSTMQDIVHPDDKFASANFSEYENFATGAKMNDELYYTDAGEDNLMGYLRGTMSASDQQFSGKIHGVQVVNHDHNEGHHGLVFSIRGDRSDLTFEGRANDRGEIHYSSPYSDVRVHGICLDEFDHCHNLLIRVQKIEDGEMTTGFVVHRTTPGTIFLQASAPTAVESPIFRWNDFIQNTKDHRKIFESTGTDSSLVNRVQYNFFRTTSVAFGESRFEIQMDLLRPNLCSELILINGPLVKSMDSNDFSWPLTQPYTEFISRNGYTQEDLGLFMGEVARATLVNNEGFDGLRVNLHVSNAVASETLKLTFGRRHVATDLSIACYLHDIQELCVREQLNAAER